MGVTNAMSAMMPLHVVSHRIARHDACGSKARCWSIDDLTSKIPEIDATISGAGGQYIVARAGLECHLFN